jgi:PKD repeat protein
MGGGVMGNELSSGQCFIRVFLSFMFIFFLGSFTPGISLAQETVDNGDSGTSSTGSWRVSGGSNPYGDDSLYSKDAGSTYTFEAALSGPYDVFFRWTGWSSRCTAVPVEIYDGDNLLDTLDVNQQENASQWYLLGTYSFTGTARVLVRVASAGCSTCVDAIRFVSGLPPELEYIEIEGPGQFLENTSATYFCRAYYNNGTDQIVDTAAWSIDLPSSDAEISSSGVLTAYEVDSDQPCNINVSYTEGDVTRTSDRKVIIKDFTGPTVENIYVCTGYNGRHVESKQNFIEMLQDIGATEVGNRWVYVNESIARTHYIYFVEDIDGMKQALMEEGAHVIFTGHSNYGHGPSFASETETSRQIIEDILYVDDPRIFNVSTEWINVSLRGMRTGQKYPFWRWVYQDGEDAKMPYDWGDPDGDPPYNYYLTYQLPGDLTHYKIETVRRGALERFSYSTPPWYSPTGEEPNPGNPDHLQYYITNPESWYPSFETEGIWSEIYTGSGFFKENYMRTSPGDGSTVARFLFRIPEAGRYKIFGWWPALNNNTTNAPFAINHASGNTTVTMNQRINGGQWNELGEFDFNVQEYSVDLSNDVSSGNVVADGVRVAHIGNPPEMVRANFYARPLRGAAPLDVRFYNISTGDLTDREWDFGDGFTNDTRDSITHTYSNPGIYTVRLTVSGPNVSDTITKTAYIWVDQPEPPLQAEFSASGRTGIYPREVRFRDRSAGNITDWYWAFGDGTNSIEPDPTHEYSFPGIYTVSLTVSDSSTDETSTETKEDLVRVIIYDNNIDNVDYPKVHFGSKTILFRKELEIQPEEMRYSRMLYDSCNSGNYYLGILHRGITFYTVAGSGSRGSVAYLKAYLEGKSDYEIWETIQDYEYVYDYFDFNRLAHQLLFYLSPILADAFEPQRPSVDVVLDAQDEAKIMQFDGLEPMAAFSKFKDAEFWANEKLLHKAIFVTFRDRKHNAITIAMNTLKSSKTERTDSDILNRSADFFIAKKILQVFPDEARSTLIREYNNGDSVTKGNIIGVLGKIAGGKEISNILIRALTDKRFCEELHPEALGEPLRICDVAYNQLVFRYRLRNVLRTIGTGYRIDVRDYHIDILRERINSL